MPKRYRDNMGASTEPRYPWPPDLDDGVAAAGGTTVSDRRDGDAASSDNMVHHHVLEVGLDERSLPVLGIIEMITDSDGI
jgi:hypothetical protein